MIALAAGALAAARGPAGPLGGRHRAAWASAWRWTFSATGHAATTSPDWLSSRSTWLHLLAMATWVGGLVVLARRGAAAPRAGRAAVRCCRRSRAVALTAVIVLAVTGTLRRLARHRHRRRDLHHDVRAARRRQGRAVRGDRRGGEPVPAGRARGGSVAFAMTDAAVLETRPRRTVAGGEPSGCAGRCSSRRRSRSIVLARDRGAGVRAARQGGAGRAVPRAGVGVRVARRRPVGRRSPSSRARTARWTSPSTLSGGGATQVTATATQPAKQLGPIPVKLTRERPGLYDGSVSAAGRRATGTSTSSSPRPRSTPPPPTSRSPCTERPLR